MGFIYLASPYSHPEMAIRVERFIEARKTLVWAFHSKIAMFSPIVHWHQIATQYELPYEAEFWYAQNDVMLDNASSIGVLITPGWKQSKGIKAELERARAQNKPCFTVVNLNTTFELVAMRPDWTVESVLAQ